MLLRRLVEYADRGDEPFISMYQEKPIGYEIWLDLDGNASPLVTVEAESRDRGKRPQKRLGPYALRTSATRPIALFDHAEYVLGAQSEKSNAKRTATRHNAFVRTMRECFEVTQEPTVGAVVRFLDRLRTGAIEELRLPQDFDMSANIMFRVNGTYPSELPSVQEYWSDAMWSIFEQEGSSDSTTVATALEEQSHQTKCFICSQAKPLAGVHPITIRGIPQGQGNGNYLVFSSSGPFWSYQLDGGHNIQVCRECAEKYGNALNELLANSQTSIRVGNIVYAFWTAEPTQYNVAQILTDPKPEEVSELLTAWRTGRAAALLLDSTPFYAVALSASGSRVVVREWLDQTLGQAKESLAYYFALQRMVDWDGAEGRPMPIRHLASATVRTRSGDAPAPTVPSALLSLALRGTPLPLDIAFQVVRRCRIEGQVSRERAALIKMVLGSQPGRTMEEIDAMSDLDPVRHDPAYLCGRLLAVIESIQRAALGKTNATVVDKFYGTASSAPASVFGTLLSNAQSHLAKLRKEREGAYHALDRRVAEIMEPLGAFPKTLPLPDQALFALGFYHQKAADRRAAQEHKRRGDTEAAEAIDPDAT